MLRMVRVSVVLTACFWTLVAIAQKEPLPDVKPCGQLSDTSFVDDWNFVRQYMDGARGLDIENSTIGPYIAKRFAFFDNWHPLLETKQVSCGKLRHFKIYNFLFGEHDWNLYLQPDDGPFHDAFNDALLFTEDRSQVWNCNTPHNPQESNDSDRPPNCFEAEVTPIDHFRANNPWFSENDTTVLPIDQKVCAMAPWVYEQVHGSRPELHPLETIWWKQADSDLWTFLEAQDASHRFDNRIDFAATPANWIPWAASPRQHLMRVALELPTSGANSVPTYTVSQVPGCFGNLAPSEQPAPATDKIYTYNGQDVLRVIEKRGDVGFTTTPRFARSPPLRRVWLDTSKCARPSATGMTTRDIRPSPWRAEPTQRNCRVGPRLRISCSRL